MGPWQPISEPRAADTRRGRGWRLTKASWQLARRDPTLAPLTLLGIACFFLAFGAMFAVIDSVDGGHGRDHAALFLLALLGGFFVWALVVAFFLVATAQAASGGFEGRPLTIREALGEARVVLGPTAAWALIYLAVSALLQLVRFSGAGGQILATVAGLLWAFLVAFVIPIVALAGAGPGDAIRESAALARRRWGEQLSGGLAIFGLTMLAALVCGIAFGVGVHARDQKHDALAAVAVVVGGVGFAATAILSFTTTQAFVVALFRFDAGELSLAQLESPPPAPPVGRGPVLRIAGAVVVLLAAAALVGGQLPDHRSYENKILVWFHTTPELASPIHHHTLTIGRREGVYYLQIGPPGPPEDAPKA